MKFKLEKDQINILLVLLLGLFVIWELLNYVGMYYDDYGNASLSYGFTVPDVAGTNYTLRQLLVWAKHCYLNWGGRILYAVVFIIPLLKDGISAYMTVQAFVLILICAMSCGIICSYTKKKYAIPAILLLYLFYGLIGRDIHAHGTYWASASVLYVWPLLPFFGGIWLYRRTVEKIAAGEKVNIWFFYLVMGILLFFSACSQEQVGLSVLVFYIFYILFDHRKDWKKYKTVDIFVVAVSLASYLLLFCSPGNFIRLGTNSEFAGMGFFEKLAFNLPRVLHNFFMPDMVVFNLLLLAGMYIMTLYLIKKHNGFYVFAFITFLLSLIYAGLLVKVIRLPFVVLNGFYLAFIVNLLLLSLFYFSYTKRMTVCALVLSGGASVFCLLYSPTVLERSYIEYLYIVFIILAILFIDCYQRYSFYSLFRVIAILLFVLFGLRSASNFVSVRNGYKANSFYLEFNHERLKSYSPEQGNIVYLAKLENDYWRGQMPYDPGQDYMEYWIKEYYNIPLGVSFQWGALTIDTAIQMEGDFYDDGWFGKSAKVTVDTAKVQSLNISFFAADGAPAENQFIFTVEGKEFVYPIVSGNQLYMLDLSEFAPSVIEIMIEAEKTYVPSEEGLSPDSRVLSAMLKIYQ